MQKGRGGVRGFFWGSQTAKWRSAAKIAMQVRRVTPDLSDSHTPERVRSLASLAWKQRALPRPPQGRADGTLIATFERQRIFLRASGCSP